MMERTVHLIDNVIPPVPIRQWVITFPYALRYRLAWNHDSTRDIIGLFIKNVSDFYVKKAYEQGIVGARTGAISMIQRFGGGLNLNIHDHSLFIDGVFFERGDGQIDFHPLHAISDEDVALVLAQTYSSIKDYCKDKGLLDDNAFHFDFDELSDESPSMAGIYDASVRGRVSLGPRSGQKVIRLGADPALPFIESRCPLQARVDGFDIHANVTVNAPSRDRLENLCRYVLRPALAQDRLELQEDGNIELELKSPYWDGTTHLLFSPIEFLEKVAALIPRPHKNLLLYHGVFAPNSAWRKQVVGYDPDRNDRNDRDVRDEPKEDEPSDIEEKPVCDGTDWASLLRRAFGIDVLECPKCQGRMRLISVIEDPKVIKKILDHLGIPTTIPSPLPARSPPLESAWQ